VVTVYLALVILPTSHLVIYNLSSPLGTCRTLRSPKLLVTHPGLEDSSGRFRGLHLTFAAQVLLRR
jgi:hypothetical protein